MSDTTWVSKAKCKGQPTRWWFPERGDNSENIRQHQAAKRICSTCPVTQQCYDLGASTGSYGTWGGVLMGTRFHAKNTAVDLQSV